MAKNTLPLFLTPNDETSKYVLGNLRESVCTEEEAIALSKRIQETGDQAAIDRLVEGNFRFVVKIAKKFMGNGIELVDLVQDGMIGLIAAAHKFDATRAKFTTFAVWHIRKEIMKDLNDNGCLVRVPHNKLDQLPKLKKAIYKFTHQYGENPSNEQLAELTGLKAEQVSELLCIMHNSKAASLDKAVDLDDEDKTPLLNFIPNEASSEADYHMSQEDLKALVARCLNSLEPRKALILKMNFGIGCAEMDLHEIADSLGICYESVRLDKVHALKELRKGFTYNPLAA